MKEDDENMARIAEYKPPEWLEMALAECAAPARFGQRWKEAALVAYSVKKLRRERESAGFMALPVANYVESLAKLATVDLREVLTWAAVSDLRELTLETIAPMIHLLQKLGVGLREALILVRIGMADAAGFDTISAMAKRSGDRRENELETCEAELLEVESQYPRDLYMRVRQVLSRAAEAFGEDRR